MTQPAQVARCPESGIFFPSPITRIPVELHYSDAEMAAMRLGFIPMSMDDKWCLFFEGDRLYFVRSWTGCVLYQLAFRRETADWVAREVIACRDENWYRFTDFDDPDHHDMAQAQFLIDVLLLRDPDALERMGDVGPLGAVQLWTQIGRAMLKPGDPQLSGPGPGVERAPKASP